jgi:hypothetical protein
MAALAVAVYAGATVATGQQRQGKPAVLLPPGIVEAVKGTTPHNTPWIFSLQRLRYLGHTLVCTQLTPGGSGACFPVAGEPVDGNPSLSAAPSVRLIDHGVVGGTCTPPRYNTVDGLVTRPGLTLWLKTPTGIRRVPLVHVNSRFKLAGGVFATIITRGPVSLVVRDATGETISTAAVTNPGDKASFCSGLDGGNPPLTPAEIRLNLKPHLIQYPLPSGSPGHR